MKKKIAIITLIGNKNFGNRLQNYALQEVIRSLGYDVETLNIRIRKSEFSIKKNLYKTIKMHCKKIIYKKIRKKNNKIKYKKNSEFTDKFIIQKNIDMNESYDDYIGTKYYAYIVGSDQVWNPYYYQENSIVFLEFVREGIKISYAASFGVEHIPEIKKNEYINGLSNFDRISVREMSGVKIVKNLIGKKAYMVLDPTMLLKKQEWLKKIDYAQPESAPYILIYFLGGKNYKINKLIDYISRSTGYKVIDILEDKVTRQLNFGPCEFIHYINNAKLILTDSYHGVVFSLLMQSPFVVFNRKNKKFNIYSRIDTLLNKFSLESRTYENINNLIENNKLFNKNFTITESILEEERVRSIKFLKQSLSQK